MLPYSIRSILGACTAAAVLLPALSSEALAQTPHSFALSQAETTLTWSVISSAGALSARSPSSPQASGSVQLDLYATAPVQSLEIDSGSTLTLPTLRSWIPSANPFMPAPFDLRLSGPSIELESLQLTVQPDGSFNADADLRWTSGTANFTFFGGPRPAVNLTGLLSANDTNTPAGSLNRFQDVFELRLPIQTTFTIVEPTSMASAAVTLSGVLVATATAVDEIGNRYCSAHGLAPSGCTLCPCGNDGSPGLPGGCLNERGSRAVLLATGTQSVSTGNLGFELRGASPNSFALLLSGDARAPSNPSSPCFGSDAGFQTTFSDGLRCITTNLERHGLRATDLQGDVGVLTPGWGANRPSGALSPVPGQTRHYQVLYRSDPTSGCRTGQNSSDALSVTAVP